MAIGQVYVYHGVETGTSGELVLVALETRTFSHEDGATSHAEVKRAEKNLPFTKDGRDGYIVTFYQVDGDTTFSEASTLAEFATAASAAITAKWPDEQIGETV